MTKTSLFVAVVALVLAAAAFQGSAVIDGLNAVLPLIGVLIAVVASPFLRRAFRA